MCVTNGLVKYLLMEKCGNVPDNSDTYRDESEEIRSLAKDITFDLLLLFYLQQVLCGTGRYNRIYTPEPQHLITRARVEKNKGGVKGLVGSTCLYLTTDPVKLFVRYDAYSTVSSLRYSFR